MPPSRDLWKQGFVVLPVRDLLGGDEGDGLRGIAEHIEEEQRESPVFSSQAHEGHGGHGGRCMGPQGAEAHPEAFFSKTVCRVRGCAAAAAKGYLKGFMPADIAECRPRVECLVDRYQRAGWDKPPRGRRAVVARPEKKGEAQEGGMREGDVVMLGFVNLDPERNQHLRVVARSHLDPAATESSDDGDSESSDDGDSDESSGCSAGREGRGPGRRLRSRELTAEDRKRKWVRVKVPPGHMVLYLQGTLVQDEGPGEGKSKKTGGKQAPPLPRLNFGMRLTTHRTPMWPENQERVRQLRSPVLPTGLEPRLWPKVYECSADSRRKLDEWMRQSIEREFWEEQAEGEKHVPPQLGKSLRAGEGCPRVRGADRRLYRPHTFMQDDSVRPWAEEDLDRPKVVAVVAVGATSRSTATRETARAPSTARRKRPSRSAASTSPKTPRAKKGKTAGTRETPAAAKKSTERERESKARRTKAPETKARETKKKETGKKKTKTKERKGGQGEAGGRSARGKKTN